MPEMHFEDPELQAIYDFFAPKATSGPGLPAPRPSLPAKASTWRPTWPACDGVRPKARP